MPNLDPHLLRAFMAVADVGTVNGAAAVLHRTQAAVSMQIRRLEEAVDAPLFERSAKGLTLNAEGLLLRPYAREILALGDELGQRLGGYRVQGRVKLGVVEDFAATRLIDILKAFHDQNPLVQIDLIVEGNRKLAKLFESNQLDLLICDTTEVSRKPVLVWHEQLLWIVRSDLSVSSAKPLPLILFEITCPWRNRVIEALSDRNVRWNLVCEASTLIAMVTAVQVGIGIGPMIAATIPAGCRSLDLTSDFPAPVDIDIGLYTSMEAPKQARYLADFVIRTSSTLFASATRAEVTVGA